MPSYKLLQGIYVKDGVRYLKGDIIPDLSEEKAGRVGAHMLQLVDSGSSHEAVVGVEVDLSDNLEEVDPDNPWVVYLEENNVADVLQALSSGDLDQSTLQSILASEQSGQGRVTIIRRINDLMSGK